MTTFVINIDTPATVLKTVAFIFVGGIIILIII